MTGERSVDVAAASGTIHVALLGGFSVRVGSRAVPGSWRLRKSKTLVKLLALAGGHRAHRDVLAGVLWPGLDPAAAANNLHQVMHAARRALASDGSPSADALCLRDSMTRFGAGQMYVNFTGEEDEDKARASYPAGTYARLAAAKAHYDPANRFRFNQNIRPAQAG